MLDLYKERFKKFEIGVAKFFSRFPLTPNQYTLLSLFFAFIFFYFLVKKNLLFALIFFFLSGILDFIDGAVARYKNLSTKKGAYLDTIIDRYVEGLFLLGILFLPFQKVILPGYCWVFLILFGSLLTTYAKASAKEKELTINELKGGILSRGERIILFVLLLILGIIDPSFKLMTYLLILIALLSNISALQRIFSALSSEKN
jgi:archaetidylinositol phosphate synthase